jgi:hypothetical protein
MINIKNEIRISLSVAFFGRIVVPFLYKDELGIFTSICFSLASLCLFYAFAIMPYLLKQEYTDLENQYHPIYHRVVQEKKAEAFVEYRGNVKLWIGAAVFLLVVGVIGFAVVHWSLIP